MFYYLCNIISSSGGCGGCVGLGDTESVAVAVNIHGCSSTGMDFRVGAKATLSGCIIEDCNIGLQLQEEAKVKWRTVLPMNYVFCLFLFIVYCSMFKLIKFD